MTTYVLGAGASYHAGFPLCSALWAQMMFWVIDSQSDPTFRQAVDAVVALNGPVTDVEEMFTNLDNGRGAFKALTEGQRKRLRRSIRRCLKHYFKSITHQHLKLLYTRLLPKKCPLEIGSSPSTTMCLLNALSLAPADSG